RRNGWNIGTPTLPSPASGGGKGRGSPAGGGGERSGRRPRARASRATAASTPSTNSGARSAGLSEVMALAGVIRAKAKRGGAKVLKQAGGGVGGVVGLPARGGGGAPDRGRRGGAAAPAGIAERLIERDAVLHRELGAGSDREMRGRLGVADQHDVVGDPALAA